MRYYLDFEATQMGGRIISIGCVNEKDEIFYSLCLPSKKENIGKKVEEMTGITNEKLKSALSAETVWNSFYNWIIETNTDNTTPIFYVYGSTDTSFIDKTIKYMKDTKAILAATSVKSLIVDYHNIASRYFKKSMKLSELFTLLNEDMNLKPHDALNDALMLKNIEENLRDRIKEDEEKRTKEKAYKPTTISIPEFYHSWPRKAKDKFEANCNANENNYKVKCTDEEEHVMYFDSLETAALWHIRYAVGGSPKKTANINNVIFKIVANSKNKGKINYKGLYWEVKE